MEEDNNQKDVVETAVEEGAKKAGRTALNGAKQGAKFAARKVVAAIAHALVSIIMAILPYIAIILVIVVIISGFAFLLELFSSDDTSKSVYSNLGIEINEDKASYISEAVKIVPDSDGYHYEFKVDIDEVAENVVSEINKNYKNMNLENKETIKQFIIAEAKTELPDLGGKVEGSNQFQGCIKIKRYTPNKTIGAVVQATETTEKTLKYVDEASFTNYLNNGNTEALDVYTLTGENKNLLTASWDWQGDSQNGNTTYKKNTEIDYRSKLDQFIMPFEYPLFFLIDGENEDFAKGLAELAENSSVEIAVIDNVETTQTDVTVEKDYWEYVEPYSVDKDEDGNEIKGHHGSNYDRDAADPAPTTTTTIDESVSTKIEIKDIKSWCALKEGNITSDFKPIEKPQPMVSVNENEENVSSNTDVAQKDSEGNTTSIADITTVLKKTTTTAQDTVASNSFKTDFDGEIQDNSQGFVDLYKEYSDKLNIEPDWLFGIMEEHAKTSNLIDITKYLLYKATGTNYGVTDFSGLDLFEGVSLNSTSESQRKVFSQFDIPNISKEEFVELIKAYQANSQDFNENLVKYAEDFYDICKAQGINPTYAFTYACIATEYGADVNNNNLFKLKDENNKLISYSSSKESIEDFCNRSHDGTIEKISESEIENKALLIFKDKIYTFEDGNVALVCAYIALHENGYTYKYLHTNDYDNQYDTALYVKESVTKDKKYYKCKYDGNWDNGTRNFGYGVLHYTNGTNGYSVGFGNQNFYREVGVNIEQEKYTYTYDQNKESIMEVEKADYVFKRIVETNRKDIVKQSELAKIELNDDEINAMCYIIHKYGPGEIPNLLYYYKQYGNTESLRQNYKAFNIANMKDWCDQLWDVFHNGKYTDPIAGKEMD
ncbi:MAG: hypothetical protein IJH76_00270, partial [Clostridia bacterium]|nr:hypothetical protein [Clostridia bacterium]